jgi:hypothetical protein
VPNCTDPFDFVAKERLETAARAKRERATLSNRKRDRGSRAHFDRVGRYDGERHTDAGRLFEGSPHLARQ